MQTSGVCNNIEQSIAEKLTKLCIHKIAIVLVPIHTSRTKHQRGNLEITFDIR